MATIFNVSETWELSKQKDDNTIVDSGVLYYWNREPNYEYYNEIVEASKVIDNLNPINSSYLASAQDIIDRAEDLSNPGVGIYGGMQLIWEGNDPIANPYNLTGFVITTVSGSIPINKIKAL